MTDITHPGFLIDHPSLSCTASWVGLINQAGRKISGREEAISDSGLDI
jgi:hypothetical protein